MGRLASAINMTLTNYASGVAQDVISAIAEFLAPSVPTGVSIGQYKEFSDKNAFQIYDTARAVGGPATRIKFDADDKTFNCKPNALEIPIDDSERDAAGDDQLGLEQAKTRTLVISGATAHENKVVTTVKAGMTAVAGKGKWSEAANNPLEEINEQIETIATNAGMMPNRAVIGLGAWRTLSTHPKVLARFPGAAVVGVTTSQFSSLLLNPSIDLRVAVLSKDTTKFGKTKVAANIFGASFIGFIASATPSVYDPSLAKTFVTKRGSINAVRTYREENAHSDVLALDWSEDVKVTGTACGFLIDVT